MGTRDPADRRVPDRASLLAASAMTRFGVFAAGMASARDPKYTIVPPRR
jgi:hypothetical protein